MNTEEIEELKEFTIDLTDIDELALGLEVCSKKSNMVIQEFADTIIQLQQENQSLKKENKILRENAEHNDKVVDKVNWENLKLKEHIEKYEHYCKTTGIEELMKENKKYKEVIEKLSSQIKLYGKYNGEKCTRGFSMMAADFNKLLDILKEVE